MPLVHTTGEMQSHCNSYSVGVINCDHVKVISPPFGNLIIVWTVPFPKEDVPIIIARPRSCSADAVTSAAEAVSHLKNSSFALVLEKLSVAIILRSFE